MSENLYVDGHTTKHTDRVMYRIASLLKKLTYNFYCLSKLVCDNGLISAGVALFWGENKYIHNGKNCINK